MVVLAPTAGVLNAAYRLACDLPTKPGEGGPVGGVAEVMRGAGLASEEPRPLVVPMGEPSLSLGPFGGGRLRPLVCAL